MKIINSNPTFKLLIVFILIQISAYGYPHPGGMHPKSQIDYVKNQILLKKEPFVSAYRQLLVKADSALLINHHALPDLSIPGFYVKPAEHRKNSLAIQADGFAAYACAMAWQLSGDKKYGEKALYFLNAWAGINTRYSDNDGPLVMSYSGSALVIAAELMHPYRKWKNTDRQKFQLWITGVYHKACNQIRSRENNWGDWGRYGAMLCDYYLDDDADMRANINLIKSDLFKKIAPDGHMIEEVKRGANGIWYTYFRCSLLLLTQRASTQLLLLLLCCD